MNIQRAAICTVALALPLLIGSGVYVAQSKTKNHEPDIHWKNLSKKIHSEIRRFPGTSGIIIKDLKNGWTIEHNDDRLFPSASLVKVPLMAALYQAHDNGILSLEKSIPIRRRLLARGSGKLRYKRPGTRLTVRELIYKMITESDNTATNMLTDIFGLDYYHSQFLSMGMLRTNLSRTIMDLKKRDRGIENYTTPQDMAKLFEMIYERRLEGSEEMMSILKDQKINDRLSAGIPADWPIAHKTGRLRRTCHDVGIIFSPTNDYLICTLTSGTRRYKRSKNFIKKISHLTAKYYSDPALHLEENQPFWTKIFKEKEDWRDN